jgi:polyhydroxybutyrate depolymerase
MRRLWVFLLLASLLTCLSPVLAQEATPEANPSPDAAPEVDETAETAATPEAETTTEPEAAAPEATIEPETTEEAQSGNQVEFPGNGSFNVREDFTTIEREFIIDIPQSYSAEEEPVPLVFVLHGAGGSGQSMRAISGFADLGETEGFISVFPSGINGGWNDGRPDPGVAANDDLAYIRHLIELLSNSLNIDASRIYATGYSMGGMMSYRLGCNLPDQIAAIASVASTMPMYILSECNPAPTLPVLVIQGTNDNIIPWMGIRNGYLSATDTMEYWTDHNGCPSETELVPEPDLDPTDPTLVILQQYADCDNEVTLYGVYGGGHTWPGGASVAPIDIGVTSRDLNATEAIWAFFNRYTLEDRQPLADEG